VGMVGERFIDRGLQIGVLGKGLGEVLSDI